jgi:hypothetical protein
VEGFINTIRNDTKATFITPPGAFSADTINTKANGISLYIHGGIVKNKLRFFARYDGYNPNKKIDNNTYKSYSGVSSPNGYNSNSYEATYSNTGAVATVTATGDITSKESFLTFGLDWTPYKGVHFMPNIFYNHYSSQLASGKNADHDLVYRMTFYFVFGK